MATKTAVLIIEESESVRHSIQNNVHKYLGGKVEICFAQNLDEASRLFVQHKERWVKIIFGNCKAKIGEIVALAKEIVCSGIARTHLWVMSEDEQYSFNLLFQGCSEEVDSEIVHLKLGNVLFNIPLPVSRVRRITLLF
jgi:hypothetical protein